MTRPTPHLSFSGLTAIAALFAGGVLTCGATSTWAQSDKQAPPDFVALGVAVVPEFEGSSERGTSLALIGRVTIGATTLRLLGNRVQWNLLPANSTWAAGPALSLRSARDEDVDDAVVKRLRPVAASAGGGVFGDYSWRGLFDGSDSLTAGVELLGGKVGAHVGAASARYHRTYFDVDADNALRSGLPRYTGERGVDEAGLALDASCDVSRDWLLFGRVQVARLVGDAAAGPIVKLRGSRNQGGLVLAAGRSS